ncbi:MAG: hypothetical protein O2960_07040 [Verrucomicrobia bacterium]|nr:hypothetical protein [Verrucomicrobiota bacterium]
MKTRFPWLWDTELDNAEFEALLRSYVAKPPHDARWAMLRLIEYPPYSSVRRLLPRERFLNAWPELGSRVRSRARREGMEFLYQWYRCQSSCHA